MEQQTTMIDVSHWRKVDYSKLPKHIRGVIIKATEGDFYVDPSFQEHIETALEAKKIVGVYQFFRTMQTNRKPRPRDQASLFCNVIKPYKSDIDFISLDWERSHQLKNGNWYNPRNGTERQALENFFREIDAQGWRNDLKLIYSNLATWQHWKIESYKNTWQGPAWLKARHDIQLWYALWSETPGLIGRLPRPFKEYFLHQYSAVGYLPGVTNQRDMVCPVDMNTCPVPFPILQSYLKTFKRKKIRLGNWIKSESFKHDRLIERQGMRAKIERLTD